MAADKTSEQEVNLNWSAIRQVLRSYI